MKRDGDDDPDRDEERGGIDGRSGAEAPERNEHAEDHRSEDVDERDEDEHEHDDEHDEHDEDDGDDDEPVRKRGERKRAAKRASSERAWSHIVPPTLLFIAAICVLDAMVNLRYPLEEPTLWYLIPSTDIAVILLNFGIMGLLGNSVPRWLLIVVSVWVFLTRLLRIGDGIQGRYFAQRFNVYTDVPLIGDGARFLHSTWPLWQLIGGGVLLIVLLVALAYISFRALDIAQIYMRQRRQAGVAGALVGVTYLVTLNTSHNARYDTYFSGGFAASAMPRFEEEIAFFWNVRGQQSAYANLIAQTQDMLKEIPSDLSKLKGTNVYLILVESYGRSAFEWPPLVDLTKRAFDAFEQDLSRRGFSMATGVLNSSTYGGQSWLAHATLDTGIPTRGQLEFEIVVAKQPLGIGTFFKRAGYRTVLVQPNTTRVWSGGDFYGFEKKYLNKDFVYRGPSYAWATMPDQYVLDFIRRREVVGQKKPLFIQYVLVSSHAPWSKLPTMFNDWNGLGDGSIFNRLPMERFPIEWPHFENATEAYGRSISYDFEVLRRYIGEFIDDGSLVIILGDHQPVAEVNGESWEMGVPLHILSKNPELVHPFVTRGFQRGMRPNLAGYAQGLETFLPSLLVDFSKEREVK